MEKLISHLNNNPQEALAILERRAVPIGLSPKEILTLIKKIKTNIEPTLKKYWG